jgi:hypothetical protein
MESWRIAGADQCCCHLAESKRFCQRCAMRFNSLLQYWANRARGWRTVLATLSQAGLVCGGVFSEQFQVDVAQVVVQEGVLAGHALRGDKRGECRPSRHAWIVE